MSITHAIKWSFLSEFASKAITPLVFVVLARLLTPQDYGVVAAATMVISFSQIFWEAGMSKAVIQYQGDRDRGANTAFWTNNLLGLVVAAALIVGARVVADRIFHDSRVAIVLQVMALQIVLSAVASVHTALLQKDMQFKRLFWVRLLTISLPGLISIPLALQGLGYWALVAGTLAGQAAQVVALWRTSSWQPSLTFDFTVLRELSRFGIWVAASGLLSWFYLWADSLVVGMYLGAHDLGLYRTGNTFVIMVYGFLFGPLLPVLYSYLSEIQHDSHRVKQILNKVVRIITFVSIPTAFVLHALAKPLSQILFGSQWHGVGLVISVMALMHGFAWTVGANGEAYRAIGRPDFETKIMAATLLLYVIVYWLSIRQGFATFLWSRLAMSLVAVGIHLWVAHLAIAFPVARTLLYLARVSVIGIPLILIGQNMEFLGESLLRQLTIAALAAAGWTITYLWLLERKSLIPETLSMFRHRSHERARNS